MFGTEVDFGGKVSVGVAIGGVVGSASLAVPNSILWHTQYYVYLCAMYTGYCSYINSIVAVLFLSILVLETKHHPEHVAQAAASNKCCALTNGWAVHMYSSKHIRG